MLTGQIDIDPDDKGLLDEMMMLRYKFHSTGSIQIESKDEMKSRGVKSPDNLDAAVYASVDLDALLNSPFAGKRSGEIITLDASMVGGNAAFYNDWVW